MTRNLKALGLALVAAFAMTAVAASAAQAAEFTAGADTVSISANQSSQHAFTVDGREVTCSTATFSGHVEDEDTAVPSVTITPTYSGCTGFGLEAHVTMNGCDYVLYASGSADLKCPEGKDVTIVAVTCTVHIPAQTGLGSVTYTTGESAGKHDLTASINITGITGNKTDGFLCPLSGSGHFSNGALHGKSTVTAKDNLGEPAHITIDTP